MEERNEKFLNLRPLVICAIFMVAGILCAYYSFLHGYYILVISLISIALAFVSLFLVKEQKTKKFLLLLLCLAFIFFSLGTFLTQIKIQKVKNSPYEENSGNFIGTIYSINYYDSGASITFKNCTFNGVSIPGKANAFVYKSELFGRTDVGVKVSFTCDLVNSFKEGDKSIKVISGEIYNLYSVANISIIDFDADFFELGYFKARSFLRQTLSQGASAVAIALTLGDTSYFPVYKLNNYRFAGIAHVFAVSGLHMGVMVSAFTFLARALKVKRKFRPFIILIPALIYCGICGFRPSSLRAFVMATVTILAEYIGFKRDNLSTLALAGIVVLAVNPFGIFDYGFRLSFVAVGSIFALSPLFLRQSKGLKGFASPISISLSAQIGTTPLLTRMSGYTSIISLFTNIIFVPVSVFLYLLTLSCLAISAIFSLITDYAKLIMKAPDLFITAVDNLLGKIDFSIMAMPLSIGYLSVVWYIAMACVSDYLNFKPKHKLIIATVSVLCVFLGTYLMGVIA